jgi:2-phosphoglycerate kinase
VNFGLLLVAIVFLLRNVREATAVFRLSLRVQRNFDRFAVLYHDIRKTNDDIVRQAREKKVKVNEGPAEPDYLKTIKDTIRKNRERREARERPGRL